MGKPCVTAAETTSSTRTVMAFAPTWALVDVPPINTVMAAMVVPIGTVVND